MSVELVRQSQLAAMNAEHVARRAAAVAALIEDCEWMAETGESLAGAARRLGYSDEALTRRLQRWRRGDVASALLANGSPWGQSWAS